VGRDRRLRQAQLAAYQSGTDAEVERMFLLGEMLLRLLQPLQDLSRTGLASALWMASMSMVFLLIDVRL